MIRASKVLFDKTIPYLNNFLAGFILSLIHSSLNPTHTTVKIVFIFFFGFFITRAIEKLTKKIYKPHFFYKGTMNFADAIDKNIGPKRGFQVFTDKKQYSLRYEFELQLVLLLITFLTYSLLIFMLQIFGLYKYLGIQVNNENFSSALILIISYLFLLFFYLTIKMHVDYKDNLDDYNYSKETFLFCMFVFKWITAGVLMFEIAYFTIKTLPLFL